MSSTVSTQSIINIIDKLKSQRFRDSTRNNYYRVWKLFAQFFIRLDIKPSSWEDKITLFVGYLVDNNLKSTTVRSYLSVLHSVLWEVDVNLNEDKVLLSALTRACKVKNDIITHRLPILKGMLKLIIDQVFTHFHDKQPYLTRLYAATFLTGFYGLL